MQIVLQELLEIGKLRFVDAGRHCEGRGVGLLQQAEANPDLTS